MPSLVWDNRGPDANVLCPAPDVPRALIPASRGDAKASLGRPPVVDWGYHAFRLVAEHGLRLAHLEYAGRSVTCGHAPPAHKSKATWEPIAPRVGASARALIDSYQRTTEVGPAFLPPGFNFTVSPLNSFGLTLGSLCGWLDSAEIVRLTGVSDAMASRLCEECAPGAPGGGDRLIKKAAAYVAARNKRIAAELAPAIPALGTEELEQYAPWLGKVSKRRPPSGLTGGYWPALVGMLGRLYATRSAYIDLPERGLRGGSKEEAETRFAFRRYQRLVFKTERMPGLVHCQAPPKLSSLLSDVSMQDLHVKMGYGAETSLTDVRREFVFADQGLLEELLDAFVLATLNDEDRPRGFDLDEEGEIPACVADAFLPLLSSKIGLPVMQGFDEEGFQTYVEPRPSTLFLSEAVSGHPRLKRAEGLNRIFTPGIWTW